MLVTELFPPAVGGSAELFAGVYSRLQPRSVTILTQGDSATGTGGSGDLDVQSARIRTEHWGLLNPAGLMHHLRLAARLRRISRADRSVVHAGRVLPEGLAAWLARLMGGARYACWAHGEELNYAELSRELSVLMRRIYRDADAILANSRNTAALVEAFGVGSDRIHVVHPGVDVRRFRPNVAGAAVLRTRIGRPNEIVLLTAGRLQRRKGHVLALRALAGLLPALPLRYVIVGDGEERGRLEQLADSLGVRDRVTFAGAVPAEELPAYYAAADLFVHPNRVEGGDFEGFGLVFLEAAASGLPVIGGASGGVPEAVQEGVTGVLVSGTDVEELKAALRSFVTSPDRRRAMGQAGRAWAARFTWERAAETVAAAHDRIAVP